MRTGLRLALGTLTVIPVGDLPTISKREAAWSAALAPVAVLPLGLLAMAVSLAGARAHLNAGIVAALVVMGLAWGTRAMHWDGLADTADGFAAGWDRERALHVMRLGNVGPTGVGVLTMVLLLDVLALAGIERHAGGWLLVGALVVVSRGALVLAASVRVPAARNEGLGSVVAASVPHATTAVVVLAATALLVGASAVLGTGLDTALVAAACGFGAVALLLRRTHRILGGITGDVMGAAIELQFCVMAIVLSGVGS